MLVDRGIRFKHGKHHGDGLFSIKMEIGKWVKSDWPIRVDIVIVSMSVGGYPVSGFHDASYYRVPEHHAGKPTEAFNEETKKWEKVDINDRVIVTYYYRDNRESEG